MKILDLSFYPDITQYRTATEIRNAVIVFSTKLSAEYGKLLNEEIKINVLPVMDVKKQTEVMQDPKQKVALGLMKPVSYVLANRNNNNVLPVGVAWRIIGNVEADTYLGQLFAQKNSGIRKIQDIRKIHRIAYGDSFSTSNFLIPAMDLYRNGVHPFTGFRSSKFFGGHDGTAKAVYFNEADVGAGHDGAIILLAAEKGYEDATDILITISKVDIYSDPVVARKDLVPDTAKLTEALKNISEDPVVTKALQDFWGNVTKIGEPDASRYKPIEDALQSLSLKDKDIL